MADDIDILRQKHAALRGGMGGARTLLAWGGAWEAKQNFRRGPRMAAGMRIDGEQAVDELAE